MNKIIKMGLLGGLLALPAFACAENVPYPEGYREWHHVKSMVITPGHALHEAFGGIHHHLCQQKGEAWLCQGKVSRWFGNRV